MRTKMKRVLVFQELYPSFFESNRNKSRKITRLAYNRFCKFLYELNLYRNVNKTKEAQRRY